MKDYVVTRKPHKCDYCERIIQPNSKMTLHEYKLPKYDDEENQIGIEYYRGYTCYDDPECITKYDIEAEEECKINGHKYVELLEPVSCYPEDGYNETGIYNCSVCGKKK